jgi:hypothetical protein
MPTRIVLLSVAEPILVEEGVPEVLDRLNQPDPVLVVLTRCGGKAVHLSRGAVALVEDAADLAAEAALSTTTTTAAPTPHKDEVALSSPLPESSLLAASGTSEARKASVKPSAGRNLDASR